MLFCSHLNGTVVFNVGWFHPRWQYFNPLFQIHKEKTMNIIYIGLLLVALAGLSLVRKNRKAREHKEVDERLYRCTH